MRGEVYQRRSTNMGDSNNQNYNASNLNGIHPLSKEFKTIKRDRVFSTNPAMNLKGVVPMVLEETKIKVEEQYSADILTHLLRSIDTPRLFLSNHEITNNLRAKMVDWMIEVMCSYKMTEDGFFRCVYFMDKYLELTNKKHQIHELHLIGVTCLLIGSKYEEITSFKLNTIYQKIGHRKLSKEAIRNKENQILEAFGFQLERPTFYQLIKHSLCTIKLDISERYQKYLSKVILYLSKMVLHHYELLTQFSYVQIASGCIYVGFKTLEQIEKTFVPEQHLKSITRATKVSEDEILQAGSKILVLAKNFSRLYPNLQNLKTYNGFSINNYE